MRRGLLVFLIVNLLIITFLVRSVSTLLSLLLEDAQADAIHRAELPSPNSSLIEQRPQIIPKIIHQTYKNESIPEVWQEAQKSCIDLHPDYEYMVTDLARLKNICANVFFFFFCSYGQTRSPANSLPLNIRGFWTHSMGTSILFSAPIPSATSFWLIMEEPILILMMYVQTYYPLMDIIIVTMLIDDRAATVG
jgi:predicted protein tyrosine phosphatase